ncbi:hypothetical protein [Flectobacillus longus]|uniref:hypothetical protein n=1 Tax=Flectobacillus longus TaxID=2984207 RepID=UPI0024B6C6C6|nr:hypothetical protein [Flectobacillus longus]MDI9882772.1 hypothetical protein [Flectobacillus longus]
MKNQKISFPLLLIAIIIGTGLYKDFNFATLTFKRPYLDIVYGVSLIFALYMIFKGKKENE